jgi:GMP synthase (glutamine-hydrolysing)
MKQAIVIRHVHFEDAGSFAVALHAQGYEIIYREAGIDDLAEIPPLDPDLVLVMGGPIGVYEDDKYPFLRDELRLLERRLRADAPTVGICLGAQLMARILGARVYPGARPEIGWRPLMLREAGRSSPLAHLDGELTPVLHWHNDTFDLPKDATLLASTNITPNQAFSWQKRCLALQFHAEATRHGFERWLIGHTHEIHSTPGCSVAGLRWDTKEYATRLELQARKFWYEWLSGTEKMPRLTVA